MKKKYTVKGYSEMMDVSMNCVTVEQASNIFDTIMDSEHYYEGHIVNNFTGEIYCYFEKGNEANGLKLTYWTAFE